MKAPSIGTIFVVLSFYTLNKFWTFFEATSKELYHFFLILILPYMYIVHTIYIVITYFPFRFCFSVYFPAKGSGTCTRASELVPFVTTEETSKEL